MAMDRLVQWKRFLPSTLRLCNNNYSVNISATDNLLGGGGFGIVFKGKDERNNKDVAVKLVEISNAKTKKYVEREKEFMNKCKHRNLIESITNNVIYFQMKEYMKEFGYFIMEYCPHGNLDQFTFDRDFTFATCVDVMRDTTEGVNYLHDNTIVHRDINPNNILVAEDNAGYYYKLSDLGLARDFPDSYSDSASASANVGTSHWRAPEILSEDHRTTYTPAVDIYSLGLLFAAILLYQRGHRLRPYDQGM